MRRINWQEIEAAKKAALEVLIHNNHGPFQGLPRTAGWGYPEPYTRDLLLSSLGVCVSGNKKLIDNLRRVLETLAKNQSRLGHIPSLVHDKDDRGASDTTPLFLLSTAIFSEYSGEKNFLNEAVQKSLLWMEYQNPSDGILIAQLPTSDWRDEQWVLGYGLFVNTIAYCYLRLHGYYKKAEEIRREMEHFTITKNVLNRHIHEGLVVKHKPYYAMWSYKVYSSERFDLLGNSLAILSGIASPTRSEEMISWIEEECEALRDNGELALKMPPNFFPFIKLDDPDWIPRYFLYNMPGDYHNGGIWPFICGFYVAALVAAKKYRLAEEKLYALTRLVKLTKNPDLEYGFNEWIKAQDGQPKGQEWQSWSAALYLYAAKCVEERSTPFFDKIRS